MIQAAVQGVIDFTQARPLDPAWRRQAHLLLNGLRRQNLREQCQWHQQHLLGLLAATTAGDDRFQALEKQLLDLLDDVEETYYPQVHKERERTERAAAKRDIGRWEHRFGSLTDDATRKRIQRTAEALHRLREETAAEERRNQIGSSTRKGRRHVNRPRRP